MHLFDTLAAYQNKKGFAKCEDHIFYNQNRHMLQGFEIYNYLMSPNGHFDIIRANIVIQALINKAELDKIIIYAFKNSDLNTDDVPNFIRESTADLPYIQEGENKIFVPIFSRAINAFYFSDYGKLLKDPYNKLISGFEISCIDCFERYSFELFDSTFTRLVKLYKDEKVLIMYHFDLKTIYIINDQGRLDARISLFDRFLKNKNEGHILERIKPVIDKYLADDKNGMLQALLEEKLISPKLYNKIKREEHKNERVLSKKAR